MDATYSCVVTLAAPGRSGLTSTNPGTDLEKISLSISGFLSSKLEFLI